MPSFGLQARLRVGEFVRRGPSHLDSDWFALRALAPRGQRRAGAAGPEGGPGRAAADAEVERSTRSSIFFGICLPFHSNSDIAVIELQDFEFPDGVAGAHGPAGSAGLFGHDGFRAARQTHHPVDHRQRRHAASAASTFGGSTTTVGLRSFEKRFFSATSQILRRRRSIGFRRGYKRRQWEQAEWVR